MPSLPASFEFIRDIRDIRVIRGHIYLYFASIRVLGGLLYLYNREGREEAGRELAMDSTNCTDIAHAANRGASGCPPRGAQVSGAAGCFFLKVPTKHTRAATRLIQTFIAA